MGRGAIKEELRDTVGKSGQQLLAPQSCLLGFPLWSSPGDLQVLICLIFMATKKQTNKQISPFSPPPDQSLSFMSPCTKGISAK